MSDTKIIKAINNDEFEDLIEVIDKRHYYIFI